MATPGMPDPAQQQQPPQGGGAPDAGGAPPDAGGAASQAPASPELMALAKLKQMIDDAAKLPKLAPGASALAKAGQAITEAMSAITVAGPQQQPSPGQSPPY